jgi:hypothetical protein
MRRRDFVAGIAGSAAWPRAASGVGAAGWRADGYRRKRFCSSRLRGGIPGRTPQARLGRPRYPARHALGGRTRVGAAAREGTGRAATRFDSFAQHAHHGSLAARDANHPNCFRDRFRSDRQWLCGELPRPGGNVTGFTNIEPTMAGKWLELLKVVAHVSHGWRSCSIRQRLPMPSDIS